MDLLPRAMANELDGRVYLSTPVTAVQQDGHELTLTSTHDGAPQQIVARFGVIAVPATALRRITLDLPLSDAQATAIDGLAYGRIVKVLIQVRRRVWEDVGLGGRTFTDGLVQATYETTAGQLGERAILTVYTADRTADKLAAMPEERRLLACLAELDRLYPGFSGAVEQAVTIPWNASSPAAAPTRTSALATSNASAGPGAAVPRVLGRRVHRPLASDHERRPGEWTACGARDPERADHILTTHLGSGVAASYFETETSSAMYSNSLTFSP